MTRRSYSAVGPAKLRPALTLLARAVALLSGDRLLNDLHSVVGVLSVAQHIVDHLPRNPERTVALRKLLEAKDAAVRAGISK